MQYIFTAQAVAAAAATTTHYGYDHQPTHDAPASWSVYDPRGLRPLVSTGLPRAPHLSRDVLLSSLRVGHIPRQMLGDW